jgi:hypothetical protein
MGPGDALGSAVSCFMEGGVGRPRIDGCPAAVGNQVDVVLRFCLHIPQCAGMYLRKTVLFCPCQVSRVLGYLKVAHESSDIDVMGQSS